VTPYRQFAAHHPNQAHFFQPILDVLDYSPSDIELVPDAVMVEGKTDFYLLSYCQDVLLRLPAEKRLRLMPGGGASTLDDLIQLYIGWSRPFVALLDSDKAGVSQDKRYREKFGAIIDRHLVQLNDASGDQNVRGMESLLSADDKLAFQRVTDHSATEFHKKTFALGVQEALVTRAELTLSSDSIAALTRVVGQLRARLDEVTEQMTA